MTSNLSRALCVVGLSAALTAAAGPAFAQGAERQILLGAVVPSSGPFAEWGRANTVTLQMLEQQVNDAGGINGAKLHISILDDANFPSPRKQPTTCASSAAMTKFSRLRDPLPAARRRSRFPSPTR